MSAPVPAEPAPERRTTDHLEPFATVIAADVRLAGSLGADGSVDLSGLVSGAVEAEGLVWLRPGGRVDGDVVAAEVVVEGEVAGDVRAAGKVDLRPTARVTGSVHATTVAVAEGSQVGGAIRVPKRDGETFTYRERRRPEPVEPEPQPAWWRPLSVLRRLSR